MARGQNISIHRNLEEGDSNTHGRRGGAPDWSGGVPIGVPETAGDLEYEVGPEDWADLLHLRINR